MGNLPIILTQGDSKMKGKRYSEEKINSIPKEHKTVVVVSELCVSIGSFVAA